MSNSRTMAMQLAVQAGTPNDQLVERAREIHKFLTDEDPLRLDVPSPKEPDNAKEVEVPIDWDRPQSVIPRFANCFLIFPFILNR